MITYGIFIIDPVKDPFIDPFKDPLTDPSNGL